MSGDAILIGKCIDANGNGINGVEVRVLSANGGRENTDSSGFFVVEAGSTGTHDVQFSKSGYKTLTVEDLTFVSDGRHTTRCYIELGSGSRSVEAPVFAQDPGDGMVHISDYNRGRATIRTSPDNVAWVDAYHSTYGYLWKEPKKISGTEVFRDIPTGNVKFFLDPKYTNYLPEWTQYRTISNNSNTDYGTIYLESGR